MPHQITPLGKWRKEVSWNEPDVMFDSSSGHSNNQITPEDYVMEREIETNGETILNHQGKIDPKKFVNKLKNVMTNGYNNMDYEQRLQLLASERPSIGSFFNMSASMELDDMIKAAKLNGQIDNNNNFHQPMGGSRIQVAQQGQPLMSSMNVNMNRLRMGNQPQQVQQPQQFQRPVDIPQPSRERIVPRPKIKANREQLKSLIAQKQQSSSVAQNPYQKGR